MKIAEIEMMLNLIATNRISDLTNYLLNERNKEYQARADNEYRQLIQAAFLKYMCNFNSKPFYSYYNNKTFLNDNVSMFVINNRFEIGIDPCNVDFSLNTLKVVKAMLVNKGIIDRQYKDLSYTVLQRGQLSYKFKSEYVDYLKTFVGKDVPIYVDTKNPVAFAESKYGEGYILGLKK